MPFAVEAAFVSVVRAVILYTNTPSPSFVVSNLAAVTASSYSFFSAVFLIRAILAVLKSSAQESASVLAPKTDFVTALISCVKSVTSLSAVVLATRAKAASLCVPSMVEPPRSLAVVTVGVVYVLHGCVT